MKIAILYGSTKKLTSNHKPVGWSVSSPDYFVRMQLFSSGFQGEFALADALSRAKPMKGETVLNTVEL